MKQLILAAATAIGLCYATGLQADQIPPIGGGYTNVTAIPVNDPAIKAISGALFKPAGAGPFPAVVYLIGCAGLDPPPIRAQLKTDIDHMLAKGMAILIVDSFTPRNEPEGVCANLDGEKAMQYFTRGGNDALAAVAVLKAMPEIDAKRIFLVGFSLGAISSLQAIDSKNAASRDGGVAGVVAYYPFCYDGVDPTVRTLVLIGEKDDWTPAAPCQAVSPARPISRSSSIPALPMSSTCPLTSLSTFSGITWSTTKRRHRTRKRVLTPLWPDKRSKSAISLTICEPKKVRKSRAV
jgi:dienelactone hydrolase